MDEEYGREEQSDDEDDLDPVRHEADAPELEEDSRVVAEAFDAQCRGDAPREGSSDRSGRHESPLSVELARGLDVRRVRSHG